MGPYRNIYGCMHDDHQVGKYKVVSSQKKKNKAEASGVVW